MDLGSYVSINACPRLEIDGGDGLPLVSDQGAAVDGELVLIHDVQAYPLIGCQNGWGVLGS